MSTGVEERPVIARPFGHRQQAIVSYRDQHWIVGAGPLGGTQSERTRPSDLLLAALTTDVTFICQDAAAEQAIPLYGVTASATFSRPEPPPESVPFNSADPDATRPIQRVTIDSALNGVVHLRLTLSGPDAEQAQRLMHEVRARSSIYRLLTKALSVEIQAG